VTAKSNVSSRNTLCGVRTVGIAAYAPAELKGHDRRQPRRGTNFRRPPELYRPHHRPLLTHALLTALEQLEAKHQARRAFGRHSEDAAEQPRGGRGEPALARAKRRLFPDLDPLEIYWEHGIYGGYG
jgi:hypothetical protein